LARVAVEVVEVQVLAVLLAVLVEIQLLALTLQMEALVVE
jgi:hypothetical protein